MKSSCSCCVIEFHSVFNIEKFNCKNSFLNATQSNDKTFNYWDVNAQTLITSIPTKYYVNSIVLSPAENFILTACGNKQDVFRKNASELIEWDKSLLSEYIKKKPDKF